MDWWYPSSVCCGHNMYTSLEGCDVIQCHKTTVTEPNLSKQYPQRVVWLIKIIIIHVYIYIYIYMCVCVHVRMHTYKNEYERWSIANGFQISTSWTRKFPDHTLAPIYWLCISAPNHDSIITCYRALAQEIGVNVCSGNFRVHDVLIWNHLSSPCTR